MFVVYILQSQVNGAYYIGQTNDINDRLRRHNNGESQSTKQKRPWKVVYVEVVDSKSVAMKRESYLKRQKSRVYVEKLIKQRGVAQMV